MLKDRKEAKQPALLGVSPHPVRHSSLHEINLPTPHTQSAARVTARSSFSLLFFSQGSRVLASFARLLSLGAQAA